MSYLKLCNGLALCFISPISEKNTLKHTHTHTHTHKADYRNA